MHTNCLALDSAMHQPIHITPPCVAYSSQDRFPPLCFQALEILNSLPEIGNDGYQKMPISKPRRRRGPPLQQSVNSAYCQWHKAPSPALPFIEPGGFDVGLDCLIGKARRWARWRRRRRDASHSRIGWALAIHRASAERARLQKSRPELLADLLRGSFSVVKHEGVAHR